MHIKTLTIQGFKSYRDQTATDPFSPRHNVIVGRNGSGKSNFFSAIRFVLSDAYMSMSREERQALLHDSSHNAAGGANLSATLSAFVEIVFDNSDHRFPTPGEEVILRRTIGLKKDEYSIDRRSASKADVGNLLEAAGFSRSNPYYIVPQGRITHLTNAKDPERLGLLKEVAGTRVYEQRRSESLKIMEETDSKRVKIEDLLKYIEERLAELDEEKEELREYYSRDRERRCLEYAIYQRESQEVSEALGQLESERARDIESSTSKRTEYNEREKALATLEAELSTATQETSELQLEKTSLDSERAALARAKTRAELLVRDLEERGEESEGRQAQLAADLVALQAEIAEKETELMEVRPEWEDVGAEATREREALEEIRTRITTLYAKQGRAAQFSTQAARDEFLQRQVQELQTYLGTTSAELPNLQTDLATARTRLQETQTAAAAKRAELESRKAVIETATSEWTAKKAARDELIERKKDLWKEETRRSSNLAYARDQLSAAQRALAGTMDKATSSGIAAVERITASLGLTGVYGPLYSLFEPEDRFKTAIEVTANTSLFHIVVDTDATASKVLHVLNREKAGRVTFMPLNRLKPNKSNLPQAADAVPILQKMRFERIFAPAFEQVFGRTIVCKSLEVCGAYVRSHGINAITLDGDRVERKGVLTGGYHDPRRSRLDAVKAVKKWRDEVETDTARLAEISETLLSTEQRITALVGEMQTLEARRTSALHSRAPLIEELGRLRDEEDAGAMRVTKLERQIADTQLEIRQIEQKRAAIEAELATPMRDGLGTGEKAELERLTKEEDQKKSSVVELSSRLNELTNRKSILEIDLSENLRRRRDELSGKIEMLAATGLDAMVRDVVGGADEDGAPILDLDSAKRELRTCQKGLAAAEVKIQEVTSQLEQLAARTLDIGTRAETVRTKQAAAAQDMGRQQKIVERFLHKRQRLVEQHNKCEKCIRDLGVLPREAYEKYMTAKSEKLLKLLHKVNEALKGYSHVNKKAVEQYEAFTKQRDGLISRQEELQNSAKSIQDLIEVLDQRKDEAIERTFKQVSKYFAEVFEKLVPAGRGRLVMQKRIDEADAMDEDAEDNNDEAHRKTSSIDSYTGVSIKVSFNSKSDEGLRIQQLSGGQKSLVALATVFAIQKCDPAPFYLFDEIDANLDAQYRTAVADMIHELADGAQFITTTFRPEMVAVADKHYGVLYNAQKVSTIRSITRDEAEQFVEAASDPAQR